MPEPSWFVGIDGQIVVDDDYIWLLRDNLKADAEFPFDVRPRRTAREAVVAVDFSPAEAFGTGLFKVTVEGAKSGPSDPGQRHVRDGVTFGPMANEAFGKLYSLLRVQPEDAAPVPAQSTSVKPPQLPASLSDGPSRGATDVPEPMRTPPPKRKVESRGPVSGVDGALESLGGIATLRELEEAIGEEVIVTGVGTSARWWSFGDVWVATGGEHPLPKPKWENEMRLLRQLADRMGVNPTTGDIKVAIRGSSLARFNLQRLAAVWQEIADAVAPRRILPSSVTPLRLDRATKSELLPLTPVDESKAAVRDYETRPTDREVSRSVPTAPRPGPRHISLPGKRPNPYSGKRIRINLDCGGHFPKALYDFATGSVEITAAEHGFVGRRYHSPGEAAAALLDYYLPGTPSPRDVWSSWRVDDGSGRTLGEVRHQPPRR